MAPSPTGYRIFLNQDDTTALFDISDNEYTFTNVREMFSVTSHTLPDNIDKIYRSPWNYPDLNHAIELLSVDDTNLADAWTSNSIWFTYPPETITGFFLDWTEYKIWWAEYNAGEWISIGDVTISWRKWPSPYGFHVPSLSEWQWLKTIMDWLSLTTWNWWKINLHMPFAGFRKCSDASNISQGGEGHYWSSSPYSANSNYARNLNLYAFTVYADASSKRANGFYVRCFKDSYVAPDSTWIVVQWTLWSAWIFWNQSEWLISITNWTTGYTMMDKNLWATTVYNDWDTLSQANMWNMYQWWNNYWFPSTWTISKTSSTQVDASDYWPTNPYSSDTFITWSEDWSSVHNNDLWGDTTWWTITQENMISNTWVLSVNGQTWDVTVASPDMSNYLAKDNTTAFTPTGDYNPATKKYVDDNVKASSWVTTTQPSNPNEWAIYYDTTNDVLKTYDWSQWNEVGWWETYNAWDGIEIDWTTISAKIWTWLEFWWNDYSAMQWPCPTWYHVPSRYEWSDVKTVWTTLWGWSTDSANFGIALKLPFAGRRIYSSYNNTSYGSMGVYWSSWHIANSASTYTLAFYSNVINAVNTATTSQCLSVRWFKDSPVVPDNTWTKLYWTSIEAGGIFRSSSLWLISMSWDWITWITIADKNLWATQVWNDWDTLSEANCGKLYQWWNNYWFPRTWTISNTSTTKVDATTYWPWNYYNSSTLIKVDTDTWDSSNNLNLWWWTTWILKGDIIQNTWVLSVNGQTGDVTIVDDTALAASWDWDTTHAPSKNAVYDAIWNIETLLAAL